ncbi:MAG: Dam family site-specific DNA-(adenine-N6)-methyltransferase [Granulosicoccaceae bacterium]
MALSMGGASRQRPFLKWAGNKYRIMERILPRLPQGRRLIEPFAGSCAVFLSTSYRLNVLNDANADLINLYTVLQDEGHAFIDALQGYFTPRYNNETTYYRLRKQFNTTDDPWLKAALFVYLNRHGYNGLCRYNAGGGFNVPFGRYKRPYYPVRELREFHTRSKQARFTNESFLDAMKKARRGDVVYCDPPYVPLSRTASFTAYSAGGFGEAEQTALAEQAMRLAARGVTVVISNHDTPFTREVYQTADCERFPVRRSISCNGAQRGMAAEILALFSASA